MLAPPVSLDVYKEKFGPAEPGRSYFNSLLSGASRNAHARMQTIAGRLAGGEEAGAQRAQQKGAETTAQQMRAGCVRGRFSLSARRRPGSTLLQAGAAATAVRPVATTAGGARQTVEAASCWSNHGAE
eukprot:gene18752-biopygen12976